MGVTLDMSALIAIERREARMAKRLAIVHRDRLIITVPTVVLGQWWRGQRGPIWNQVLAGMDVEPLEAGLARIAGEALARSGTSDIVDAVVVASAAQRGDVVYTGDVGDLQQIAQSAFPSVRVLGI